MKTVLCCGVSKLVEAARVVHPQEFRIILVSPALVVPANDQNITLQFEGAIEKLRELGRQWKATRTLTIRS